MKSHIKRIQICIFILLHFVICQGLKGFVGKSVLLPCSSTSLSKVEVFWRDRNNKVLLDIKNGSEDLSFQDKSYKGRVSSFPAEYQNKNYSITLKNLKLEDTGTYECIVSIDSVGTVTKIELEVKEDVKSSHNAGDTSRVSSRRIVLQTLVLSALSLIIYF